MLNYSPLRYPGGKTKIAPLVKLIINKIGLEDCVYIEPFAGGAGVALALLFDGIVSQIVINDYDKAIYSFWRAILEKTDEFIELIKETPLSIEQWHVQKQIYMNDNKKYSLQLGFATFYLNRMNRSGILNAGPIGGFEQTGNYLLNARFNKNTLIEKIQNIANHKMHIAVYNKDIISFVNNYIPRYEDNAFVYFDPPYYNKGKELYKNFFQPEDHARIARNIFDNVDCSWIVTYDDVQPIKELYDGYEIKQFNLNYSVANGKKGSEIIVFNDAKYCPLQNEIKDENIKIQLF